MRHYASFKKDYDSGKKHCTATSLNKVVYSHEISWAN